VQGNPNSPIRAWVQFGSEMIELAFGDWFRAASYKLNSSRQQRENGCQRKLGDNVNQTWLPQNQGANCRE
jgi:hypothetical protein